MKKLSIMLTVVLIMLFSTAVQGAENRQIFQLHLENAQINTEKNMVVVKLLDSTSTKEVEITKEALDYMDDKGLKLLINMPKVTMTISPDAFYTREWQEALKTREPVKAKVILKKGDMIKVTDNFDEWYYRQLGMHRFSEVAYDLSAEIRVAGKKAYDITRFAVPVTVQIRYPYESSTNVVEEDYLGVYFLDEATQKWVPAGGTPVVDKSGKTITVTTDKTGLLTLITNLKRNNVNDSSDIKGHWAESDILFMKGINVVVPDTNGRFFPNREITRGEYAGFLVRTLSLPENTGGTVSFSDVPTGSSYYREVLTAANAGLVQGVGGGRFAPVEKITREQMAVMMARALQFSGYQAAGDPGALKIFADSGKISSWAREGSATAVKAGLIGGRAKDRFAPKEFTGRAEALVMLHRLYNILNK